ncbi:MAG: response regulator [bacterium]
MGVWLVHDNMTQTILMVDDDKQFIETLKDNLVLKGVEVATANSGNEALSVLEKITPAIILLDVQLPDMNGFELCRILKKSVRLKRVPIILLSAKYTEPADRTEGMLSGADSFISKPLGMDVLWDEVKYLLDKKS